VDPPQPIRPATRADKAFRRLIRAGAAAFARHLATLMTRDDPEGPHKARVALRRLRAVFTAFRPVLRTSVYRRQTATLRDLGREIGRLRDADVLALALQQPDLTAAAATQRALTRRALRKAHAARWADRLAAKPGPKSWFRKRRKDPVLPLAVRALDHATRRCLSHGPDLTMLAEDARHDLRKSLKTLRYLSDHFRPLWPQANPAFVSRLSDLQEDLGHLNDITTARARGLDRPDDPATLHHAQTLWAALQSTPRFWKTP
jgi:CHAD domain-containing protein